MYMTAPEQLWLCFEPHPREAARKAQIVLDEKRRALGIGAPESMPQLCDGRKTVTRILQFPDPARKENA